MSLDILTLTENYAIVKVVGTGTESLTLSSLISPTQEQAKDSNGDSIPFKVGINFIQWATGDNISITRDGTKIVEIYGSPGSFNYSSDYLSTDYTKEDKDISITIAGGGTVLLKLRKAGGFASKIEPEYFGQYDNITKVGE